MYILIPAVLYCSDLLSVLQIRKMRIYWFTGEFTLSASKESNSDMCPSYINSHLKNEASIKLYCQLCPACHTVVQFKAPLRSKSIWTISFTKKLLCVPIKSTLFVVSKDKWNRNKDTGNSMKNVVCILKTHLLD